MSIFQAVILGFIQGITEFLPISSSAHLVIVPDLLKWPQSPLVFDTSLHLGTALAIGLYFFKDFLRLVTKERKSLVYILVASIPVMGIGYLFGDLIENSFRSLIWISVFLVIGSVVMFLAEFYSKKVEQKNSPNLIDSLVIGCSQIFALFPGISRSGVTISAGLFSKLNREEAARFSFLLSTPVVCAAGVFKLLTTFSDIKSIGYAPWAAGVLVSFISGYLSIGLLLRFLRTKSLKLFIVYRILLAAVLIFFTTR